MIKEGFNKQSMLNKKYDKFEREGSDKSSHIGIMKNKHWRHRAYECDFGYCYLEGEDDE